jgi:hypothetical protein
METVGTILGAVAGLGSLVCYVLVLIKMFQNGQTGLGIACIVLLLCCGLGGLIAFVYGWIKAGEWGITNIMMIWTVFVVLNIASGIMNPGQFQQLRQFQPG